MESLRESILEKAKHKREKDRRVNGRMMQSKGRKDHSSKALDDGLVVTESNETESERHVLSSRSGNDTHTDDADINSVNDKQPKAECHLDTTHHPAVAAVGTVDSTNHTAVEHVQVGCKLPIVEHCKPQPCARILQHIYPTDTTAYKSSSLLLPGVSLCYPSFRTSLASMLSRLSG
ncbi:hypothetical protein Tco_0133966 [Tanacetum coccineum]